MNEKLIKEFETLLKNASNKYDVFQGVQRNLNKAKSEMKASFSEVTQLLNSSEAFEKYVGVNIEFNGNIIRIDEEDGEVSIEASPARIDLGEKK